MNFKIRSAVLFTALVAIILLASYIVIYLQSADFTKDEFYLRLEQKAISTYKLFIEKRDIVVDIEGDLDAVNDITDERLLIFNQEHKLMFSSINDNHISFSTELLNRIEQEKVVKYTHQDEEVVGLYVTYKGKPGLVMVSANDLFGKTKLKNLLYTLLFSYFSALMITAILSYFYVKQSFAPIDVLNKQISRISQNRLNERVPVGKGQDELNQLASNFNNMLNRIESAFTMQRSFIQHASHELRTPLTNLITTSEAALNKQLTTEEYRTLIESLNEEHQNLVDLTNALLMLSKYENESKEIGFTKLRGDELLFGTLETVQNMYPNHVFHFKFNQSPQSENELTLFGNATLLEIALGNLLRNACKYSTSAEIDIHLTSGNNMVVFDIKNTGPTLENAEIEMMKQPFFRGNNVGAQKGFGLGLSIVNRILELHKGTLTYQKTDSVNTFTITIPQNNI